MLVWKSFLVCAGNYLGTKITYICQHREQLLIVEAFSKVFSKAVTYAQPRDSFPKAVQLSLGILALVRDAAIQKVLIISAVLECGK
jgi:hypothetical protein